MGYKFFKSEEYCQEAMDKEYRDYLELTKKDFLVQENLKEFQCPATMVKITEDYLEPLINLREIFFFWQRCTNKASYYTSKYYFNDFSNRKNLFLAIQHEFGIDGFEKDYSKALQYYIISAVKDKISISYYYLFLLLRINPSIQELDKRYSKKLFDFNIQNKDKHYNNQTDTTKNSDLKNLEEFDSNVAKEIMNTSIKKNHKTNICDYFVLTDYLVHELKDFYSKQQLTEIFSYYKEVKANININTSYSLNKINEVIVHSNNSSESKEKDNSRINNNHYLPVKDLSLYFLLCSISYLSPNYYYSEEALYGVDYLKSLKLLINPNNKFGYKDVVAILKFLMFYKKNNDNRSYEYLFSNDYEFRFVKIIVLSKIFCSFKAKKILEIPYKEFYQVTDSSLYNIETYSYVLQELKSISLFCNEAINNCNNRKNTDNSDITDNTDIADNNKKNNKMNDIRLSKELLNSIFIINLYVKAHLAYIHSPAGISCFYLKIKNSKIAEDYYNEIKDYQISDNDLYSSNNNEINLFDSYIITVDNSKLFNNKYSYLTINVNLYVNRFLHEECTFYYEEKNLKKAFYCALKGYYFNNANCCNSLFMIFFMIIAKEDLRSTLYLLDKAKEAILLVIIYDCISGNKGSLIEFIYIKKILWKYLKIDLATYKEGFFDFNTEINCVSELNNYLVGNRLDVFNGSSHYRVSFFILKIYLQYLDYSDVMRGFNEKFNIENLLAQEKEKRKILFYNVVQKEVNYVKKNISLYHNKEYCIDVDLLNRVVLKNIISCSDYKSLKNTADCASFSILISDNKKETFDKRVFYNEILDKVNLMLYKENNYDNIAENSLFTYKCSCKYISSFHYTINHNKNIINSTLCDKKDKEIINDINNINKVSNTATDTNISRSSLNSISFNLNQKSFFNFPSLTASPISAIINSYSDLNFLNTLHPMKQISSMKRNLTLFSKIKNLTTDINLHHFISEIKTLKKADLEYYNNLYYSNLNNTFLQKQNLEYPLEFLDYLIKKMLLIRNSSISGYLAKAKLIFLDKIIFCLGHSKKILLLFHNTVSIIMSISNNSYIQRHLFTYQYKFFNKLQLMINFCIELIMAKIKICNHKQSIMEEMKENLSLLKENLFLFKSYLEFLFKKCFKDELISLFSKSFLYSYAQLYDNDINKEEIENHASNCLIKAYQYYLFTQHVQQGTIFECTLLSFWRGIKAKMIINYSKEFYLNSLLDKINFVKSKKLKGSLMKKDNTNTNRIDIGIDVDKDNFEYINSGDINSIGSNIIPKSKNSKDSFIDIIKNENNEINKEAELCVICLEKEVSEVFIPCFHCICCDVCVGRVLLSRKCPFCRRNILFYT